MDWYLKERAEVNNLHWKLQEFLSCQEKSFKLMTALVKQLGRRGAPPSTFPFHSYIIYSYSLFIAYRLMFKVYCQFVIVMSELKKIPTLVYIFICIFLTKVVRAEASARWLTRPTLSTLTLINYPAFLGNPEWKVVFTSLLKLESHQIVSNYLSTFLY